MNSRIVLAILIGSCGLLTARRNYVPDFQEAVVTSNKEKIESLFTRKNKVSEKNIKEMTEWSHDVVEECAALHRTSNETLALQVGRVVGLISLWKLYKFVQDANYERASANDLQNLKQKIMLGAGCASWIASTIYWYYAPHKRLAKAYETQFYLDDVYQKMLEEKDSKRST